MLEPATGKNGGSIRGAPRLVLAIPGAVWWFRGDRSRAVVGLVSYLSALMTAGGCWGSLICWAFLAWAGVIHGISLRETIRLRAFPGFSSSLATSVAAFSLMALYTPLLIGAWVIAWPVTLDGRNYLVNRWAYRNTPTPASGHWVWVQSENSSYAAYCLGAPDQIVPWRVTSQGLQWEPSDSNLNTGTALAPILADIEIQVPPGHILVSRVNDPGHPVRPESLQLVELYHVRGRIWAQPRSLLSPGPGPSLSQASLIPPGPADRPS